MAYKRIEYPKGLTPRGVAVFPHLNTPDTKFNPDKPVYKVNLRLSDTDAQPIVERIDAMLAALKTAAPSVLALLQDDDAERLKKAVNNPKGSKAKPAALVYAVATDADGNDLDGETVLKLKANAKRTNKKGESYIVTLPLFDAKKQPVTSEIWGGSELRVSFTLRPWVNPQAEYGVKLAIEAVQVIQLRTKGQGGSDGSEFDEEEGYEAPAETPAVTNTASDSSDDGDF